MNGYSTYASHSQNYLKLGVYILRTLDTLYAVRRYYNGAQDTRCYAPATRVARLRLALTDTLERQTIDLNFYRGHYNTSLFCEHS